MKKQFFILVALLVLTIKLNAQCSNCSTIINDIDTNTYIVNLGQTLCIDSISTFAGNITLNGGVVCNKGLFKPSSLVITSGQLINFSNISIEGYNLDLNSSTTLTCIDGSVLNITSGHLRLLGGTLINSSVISVIGNIQNTSGTLNNYGQINCNQLNGNSPTINTGQINSN